MFLWPSSYVKMSNRYVSTGVVLVLSGLMAYYGALWGYTKLPRVNRMGCIVLVLLMSLTVSSNAYTFSLLQNLTFTI